MARELRFAVRTLVKRPGFSLIAVLTLALGIGATSAVFSLIQGVLLTPPPYRQPQRLVLIPPARTDGAKMDGPRGWPAQQWLEWQKETKSFEGIAGYGWTFNFLIRNDGSQSMQGMEVSKDYLSVMGLKPAVGRVFEEQDFQLGPVKAIVLGYEFWQRAFGGDPQIIGKTVRISRWDVPPTVIGVMQRGVRFLPSPGAAKEPNYNVNATVDFWVPSTPDPKYQKEPYWDVVARLRNGATASQSQRELSVIAQREAQTEKAFEGFTPQLEAVTDEMNRDGRKILLPLLGAAALVLLMNIAKVPSGYNTGRILTMSVTEVQSRAAWGSFHRQALERVAALPGIQYAAFAWGVPLTGNNWPATLEIEGQPPAMKESDKAALPLRAVTPDYFKLMGMALVEGREFRSTDDDKAANVAIVNQAFTDRYFSHENPVGRKFWLNGRDKPGTEIVGEISNGRTDDLTEAAAPEIYLPLWQATAFSKHLVVRTTADPRAVVLSVQRELRAVDPTAAIENVKTLEQIRDESLASRTFAMQLLVGFSAVGSVLTLVGVYGVLSLSVASRRRELAIRSAVGAEQKDIRKLIFGEGFRLIAAGVAAGVGLAIVLSRVLRTFLFEVQPGDPATLAVVGGLFVAVALLACWSPVRRAAKVDPLEALRYE